MGTTRFFSLALAVLMLGGCSKVSEFNEEQPVATGDTGFVRVAINLPRTSGTRAVNDNFDDGLPAEYAVNDAYLLVFGGNTENDATYSASYKLTTSFGTVTPDNDNITSKSEVVQAIKKPSGANVYALVVLNNNGILRVADASSGSALIPGTTKLTDLQEKLVKDVGAFIKSSDKASFTMTNAPIASMSGSNFSLDNQQVTTLVKLNLYSTEEEAKAKAASEIYVERVVAKVTVSSSKFSLKDGKYVATIDNEGNYKNDEVSLDAWYLNVTNKSTKFVRDVSDWGSWKTYPNSSSTVTDNRFFGTTSGPYRVYWAIDNNYDDNDWTTQDQAALNNEFYIYNDETPNTAHTMGNVGENVLGTGQSPAYCLENTFVTSHMNKKETTAIVFKMTYTLSGEAAAKTFYVLGMPQEANETCVKEGLADAVNAKLVDLNVELKSDIDNLDAGYYDSVADMKSLFVKTGGTELSDEEAVKILTAVNMVRVYKDGISYYGARIQHFGDYYTPLSGRGVADASEYDPQKHLGRYGVVRNNWYVVNIADITGPGRPTSPDPSDPEDPEKDDPDDPFEDLWIKCNINILSWAKRVQDVDL